MILSRNVCGDCGLASDKLPSSGSVREVVRLLSFQQEVGERKRSVKKRYFGSIVRNRNATVVKVIDRCNHISTMQVLSRRRYFFLPHFSDHCCGC